MCNKCALQAAISLLPDPSGVKESTIKISVLSTKVVNMVFNMRAIVPHLYDIIFEKSECGTFWEPCNDDYINHIQALHNLL